MNLARYDKLSSSFLTFFIVKVQSYIWNHFYGLCWICSWPNNIPHPGLYILTYIIDPSPRVSPAALNHSVRVDTGLI